MTLNGLLLIRSLRKTGLLAFKLQLKYCTNDKFLLFNSCMPLLYVMYKKCKDSAEKIQTNETEAAEMTSELHFHKSQFLNVLLETFFTKIYRFKMMNRNTEMDSESGVIQQHVCQS